MYYVNLIYALFLVSFAPQDYSYPFVVLVHHSYLCVVLYSMWEQRKEGFFTFHNVFSLSFYFVNFVYPVFYYLSPEKYFGLFSYSFNEHIISRCTAIAYFAYAVYICTLFHHSVGNTPTQAAKKKSTGNRNSINLLTIALVADFLLFLANGGRQMFSLQYTEHTLGTNPIAHYLFEIVYCASLGVIIMVFFFTDKKHNLKSHVFPLGIVLFINLIVLLTGFRTFTICFLFTLLALYSDRIKRINFPVAVALLIIGGIFFNAVRIARREVFDMSDVVKISMGQVQATELDSGNGLLDNAFDLIINNRSLYFLIGFAEEHGYTWGLTLLGGIIGVIPFGQTIFMSITGVPAYLLGSATLNTIVSIGANSPIGVGTNAVSDLYLAFGNMGVIVGFLLLGYAVRISMAMKEENIYYAILYYTLVYRALFIPRSSIFFSLRVIVWTMFLVYVIQLMLKKKRKKSIS